MNKNNVIFLDFDGPMFPARANNLPGNNGEHDEVLHSLGIIAFCNYYKMDPIAVSMLMNLWVGKERRFDLVISSTWADIFTEGIIKNVLMHNGCTIPLHKEWCLPEVMELDYNKLKAETGRSRVTRALRISKWLERNKETLLEYVIIDDYASGEGLSDEVHLAHLGIPEDRIIIVDLENGISQENYKRLQWLTREW
jgi:hypothetical protein